MDVQKRYMQFKQVVKQKRGALLFSLCNVLILLLLSYILNNQPLFTGEDLNKYAWMEWLTDKIGSSDNVNKDDALFINIAYDKQLVEKTDKYGMSSGNTDITDRLKLLNFLKLLHKTDSYKYILLDVRFEKGYNVPDVDSALYAEILSMRNIVIADHSGIELADNSLKRKAALSDYNATIVATNFVRYQYRKDSVVSVPLYVYHEITGKTINKFGWIYTCDNRLCYNSLFVHFPIDDWNEYNENNEKVYYNLGSDILDNYSEDDLKELVKDKYIIIGDMVEDIHDTYSGVKPGSVITFYSFKELMNGHHFVNYGILFILSIIYFLISIYIYEKDSIFNKIPFIKNSKSRFLHFIMNFVEYTLLLTITMVIMNVIFGIATSILLPSTYFALEKSIIGFKRLKI